MIQEVGQIVRTRVAEVDVVGMLPNVTTQQGRLAEAHRIHAVLCLGHFQATIGVLDQPRPTRTELTGACRFEVCHHFVDRTKALDDRFFQLTRHFAIARTHHLPELVVVPQLADVVENAVLRHGGRIIGAFDDLFEGLVSPFGALNGLVPVGHISVVVLVVVEFQCLGAHAFAGKSVVGIGKIGK